VSSFEFGSVTHLRWMHFPNRQIALSTGTNLLLTVTLSLAFLEGACKRITGTTSGVRVPPFFAGSQFLATSVSLGLGLIVFANPESPAVHLWLGLPLVYPINVLSTLGHKQSARADLEAEAEKAGGGSFAPSYRDEKRSNVCVNSLGSSACRLD
jgi:hypothetical protein